MKEKRGGRNDRRKKEEQEVSNTSSYVTDRVVLSLQTIHA